MGFFKLRIIPKCQVRSCLKLKIEGLWNSWPDLT